MLPIILFLNLLLGIVLFCLGMGVHFHSAGEIICACLALICLVPVYALLWRMKAYVTRQGKVLKLCRMSLQQFMDLADDINKRF